MVEQYKTQIRGQVLESMVIEQLLAEQVKKAGIEITEKDVNDKLSEIIASQPGGMTIESFKAMIAAQGQSFDVVKEQIKKTLGYEKLLGTVEVNDAEAKAFYDENKEDFNKPEQVKASHILIKVAPTATTEEKAAAKAKIDGLLKQVKAGGDFAALAKENSDCPSKERGGDLGFFEKSAMVKEFADAAFSMKVGQISDVVETQFGYHIIKVTDRKEGGLTPFDKAKTDIVKQLQDKKKGEIFKQLIDKLKAQASIVYPPGKEPQPRMPMMPRGARPNAPAPQPAESKSTEPAPN
jgi:peptidyl-prolyl cis-trans isomerase C